MASPQKRRRSSSLFFVLLIILLFCLFSVLVQNQIMVHVIISKGLNGNSWANNNNNGALPKSSDDENNSLLSAKTKIAYVVSLIHCHKTSMTTGFIDAAAVLRHSVHKQSVHYKHTNTNKADSPRYGPPGRYSYDMIAIVHSQCAQHGPALERLGYIVELKDNPLPLDQIKGEWYRTHVEGEMCCGFDEFIKLHAYTLTNYPVFVHLDMDVILLQPLDDLFDAIILPANSKRGKRARAHIQANELEYKTDELPSGPIDAFLTRDITSTRPGETKSPFQGGFLVARPDLQVYQQYVDIIREGNYTKGRGEDKGWGNLGYAGWQGALAIQGLVAYFYDIFRPNTFVELNVCRWNQVVADVIWRGPDLIEYNGMCRRFPRGGPTQIEIGGLDCEDCRIVPPHLVKTMHYTACHKPWECSVPHPRVPGDQRQVYRLSHLTNITTCMLMHKEWFQLRQELEDSIVEIIRGDNNSAKKMANSKLMPERVGTFEKEFFLGYCRNSYDYIPMVLPENFTIERIYA